LFSQTTADELHRAVLIRVSALREIVRELRGALGRSRQSLSEALSLLDDLPDVIVSVVEHELNRASDLRSKIGILTSVLRHINYVLDLWNNTSLTARDEN
jgi:hypothetical protein